MRKMYSLALVAMMMLATTACTNKKETTDGVNNFKIERGTNVSHWLSQSEERGEARLKHIQEDDFARLDSLGFDFVRLPIDEVQFWDEDGNKLPEAWELMINASTGLRSIICAPSSTCTSSARTTSTPSMRTERTPTRSSPRRRHSRTSSICGTS